MPDLIEEARAAAEQLRATVRDDELPDLLDRLCDALVECGYDLTGQWAAWFEANPDYPLPYPAANERHARQIVSDGRKADPRWKLMHRATGPWKEVPNA